LFVTYAKLIVAKFWQHQDMIYDFQAELHGTGSRSLHNSYKLQRDL